MGYFSNGTEGRAYQAAVCNHCEHDVSEDCPVWLLHLVHNSDGRKDKYHPINILIPFDEGGPFNGNHECRMFIGREIRERPTPAETAESVDPAYWTAKRTEAQAGQGGE